jgi:hypothetical protein
MKVKNCKNYLKKLVLLKRILKLQNTKSSNENDKEKEYTTSNTLVVEFNLNNKLN